MSIQVTVTDPAKTPVSELRLIIELLQRFAQTSTPIPAPDLPDVGAPNGHDAAAAFQAGAVDANSAFGGPAAATPEAAFAPFVVAAPSIPAAAGAAMAITAPAAAAGSGPNVAPPPPPNGAPPAPVNPASTVGLDSAGLPYDARIHAKSSSGPGGVTVAGGTWRKKRGVDDALVVQVEAELRALMAAPVPHGYVEPVRPNVAPPPPTSSSVSPTAAAIGSPVSAPCAAATTFPDLVNRVAAALGTGALGMDQVTAVCAAYGVADMTLLPQRLDLLPMIAAGIQNLINGAG